MVEDSMELDAVFHALAHDARRSMMRRLAAGDLTVGELAEPLHMSLAAASKHIKVLEQAGLVQRTVIGRRHVCRLRARPLSDAAGWLRFYEEFWDARLDALREIFTPAGQTGPDKDDHEPGDDDPRNDRPKNDNPEEMS